MKNEKKNEKISLIYIDKQLYLVIWNYIFILRVSNFHTWQILLKKIYILTKILISPRILFIKILIVFLFKYSNLREEMFV